MPPDAPDTVDTLILYAFLTTAMFYLGSRAQVTSWLWSRYPPRLAKFMDCPACSGTWYGAIVALIFRFPLFSLPGDAWYTPIAAAGCSMVWTPIVAAIMHTSFARLGDATPEETSTDEKTDGPG